MIKRLLCLFLALTFVFCLAACGDEESAESSAEASKPVETKIPKINGVSLSKFTVVFKNNSGDAAKFSTAAQSFIKKVKEEYGVSLRCVTDSAKENEYEIIFGVINNRDICKDYTERYDVGNYCVEVKDKKVLFAATYANGALGASEAFLTKLSESEKVTDMKFEGEKKVVRVACVGDSITYGATSTSKTKTYPVFLQEMLGLDYYVFNAGISGYSIVSTDQFAYKKSPEFQQAKSFKPDVVLFALGTNDANPTDTQPYKNWENEENDRANKFVQSTNELFDAFTEINEDVQIIMLLPSALFKVGADEWNADAWNANLDKYVTPLLKDIAKDKKLQTVDLRAWSLENESVFVDGLHPKDDTYKTFAQFVYESIKDTVKKP
ncbi:MAG: hypothetical protein IKU30_03690 [Clostridia bacterium]|nr:hypothetical protein [Clostridia bacterium]